MTRYETLNQAPRVNENPSRKGWTRTRSIILFDPLVDFQGTRQKSTLMTVDAKDMDLDSRRVLGYNDGMIFCWQHAINGGALGELHANASDKAGSQHEHFSSGHTLRGICQQSETLEGAFWFKIRIPRRKQ